MPDGKEKKALGSEKERLLIAGALLLIAALFFFFIKDTLIPFLRLELQNDVTGAQALLRERGLPGFLTFILAEALQRAAVFIPPSFIRIASGRC